MDNAEYPFRAPGKGSMEYGEWEGVWHESRPDYLIRLRGKDSVSINVILEIKGFESEQDRQKEVAARRWVRAVNHHGEFGHWQFLICREPGRLRPLLMNQYCSTVYS